MIKLKTDVQNDLFNSRIVINNLFNTGFDIRLEHNKNKFWIYPENRFDVGDGDMLTILSDDFNINVNNLASEFVNISAIKLIGMLNVMKNLTSFKYKIPLEIYKQYISEKDNPEFNTFKEEIIKNNDYKTNLLIDFVTNDIILRKLSKSLNVIDVCFPINIINNIKTKSEDLNISKIIELFISDYNPMNSLHVEQLIKLRHFEKKLLIHSTENDFYFEFLKTGDKHKEGKYYTEIHRLHLNKEDYIDVEITNNEDEGVDNILIHTDFGMFTFENNIITSLLLDDYGVILEYNYKNYCYDVTNPNKVKNTILSEVPDLFSFIYYFEMYINTCLKSRFKQNLNSYKTDFNHDCMYSFLDENIVE